MTRHDFDLRFQPGKPGRSFPLMLTICRSEADDRIRNIRIVPVGRVEDFQETAFRDAFLEDLRPLTCISFMDWCQTNWPTEVQGCDSALRRGIGTAVAVLLWTAPIKAEGG